MFRMYGNTVQLYRYKIEYEDTEIQFTEDEAKPQPDLEIQYCISEEHKDEIIRQLGDKKYTVTEMDQTENEWINGLPFESYELAKKALEIGQDTYKEAINEPNEIDLLQLALVEQFEKNLEMQEKQTNLELALAGLYESFGGTR